MDNKTNKNLKFNLFPKPMDVNEFLMETETPTTTTATSDIDKFLMGTTTPTSTIPMTPTIPTTTTTTTIPTTTMIPTATTTSKVSNVMTVKEAPKSKFKMATEGLGRTLGAILGVISIPETLVGGTMESQVKKLQEWEKTNKGTLPPLTYMSSLGGGTPKYIFSKALETLKGNLGETGTQKGLYSVAEEIKGSKLTKGQHAATTAVSILLDIAVNPSTYLTLGGSSGIKIGSKGVQAGLTKAGTKAYAGLIKEGVAKGLTREAATEFAQSAMEQMLKSNADEAAKLFSKGGIRFAEWIPKVGGESIIPYSDISKFVEPIGKYTGLGKVYKGLQNLELTRAVKKAVSPTVGVPEELYKAGKKAKAFREYETIKAAKEYITPLKKLGSFTNSEAEDIFNAIRKADVYDASPDKIKKAVDIIAQRFSDIRKSLIDRGVDIGYIDRYAPQLYADEFGKEFAENIKRFASKLPEEAAETARKVTVGGMERGKEFFEYPRLLFNTVEEAEKAGFKIKKNIFDLLNAYESGANRIHAFMDVVEKVKPIGIDLTEATKGIKVSKAATKATKEAIKGAKEEAIKIPEGFVRGSGLLENYAFPKDIANYLGSFQKTFFNNAELKTFLKYYDNAMRWWKTMATVVSPGFHMRNFLSNIFNSWLGGNKNPANYIDAAKIFKGTGEVTTQAGEKVAGSTILDEAAKRGVLGRGWFGYSGELGKGKLKEELAPITQKVLKGINPLSAESYLAKGGRKFGATVEEYSRLAHFIDVFKKTGNFDNAAEETFKYLFDYSDLTPFWKNVVNRTFPFGTWLRKNTALQFEQLVKQPAKYRAPIFLKKFIEAFSEDEKPEEKYLPEYLKKELAIRLPLKDKEGNFIYMRLDLPYLGISDVTDWRTLLGGITPAAKIPTELMFGKELFTGKPIERYPGYTEAVPGYIGILPDEIKKRLGVVKAKNPKTGKFEERMNPYVAYLLRQNPLMSKIGKLIPFPSETEYQTTSRPYSMASILAGIGITPYDVQYRKKVYEKEQKEARRLYEKRLKELKNMK